MFSYIQPIWFPNILFFTNISVSTMTVGKRVKGGESKISQFHHLTDGENRANDGKNTTDAKLSMFSVPDPVPSMPPLILSPPCPPFLIPAPPSLPPLLLLSRIKARGTGGEEEEERRSTSKPCEGENFCPGAEVGLGAPCQECGAA